MPAACGRLDIAVAIANDKTSLVAHRPVLHQIVDHAGRRFAPMMVFEIAGDGAGGMMRTIADVVDPGALRGEFVAHPVVQRIDVVFREVAARHAGLVGEEEHEISGVVQASDRLRRIRHPADPFLRADIAVVMIDDAVAIEKGGGARREPGMESVPVIS